MVNSTSRWGGGSPPISLWACTCLGGALFLTGCPRPCQGPGCGDAYSAATVTILSGEAVTQEGTLDARASWAELEGLAEQDRDWTLLPSAGTLIVGIPGQGAVGSLPLRGAGELSLLEVEGVIAASVVDDRLGAALGRPRGTADLLIGAPSARSDLNGSEQGAVLLFAGVADGFASRLEEWEATLRVESDQSGGAFGSFVEGCGDVDGDGLADWMSAAPRSDAAGSMAGEVFLVGSADWSGVEGTLLAEDIETRWRGTSIGARVGSAMACGGDLTGDGLADAAVGGPFEDGQGEARGVVHLIVGGVRLATGGVDRSLAIASGRSWEGADDEDWFGMSLASGDLDGDGVDDLAIGAPGASEGQGEVRVSLSSGRGGGLVLVSGEGPGDGFGRSTLIVDLDLDGRQDLMIGAPFRNPDPLGGDASFQAGTLYAFAGPDPEVGWPIVLSSAGATRRWVRAEQYLQTGQRFWVEDLDTDGAPELLLLHRTDPR